MTLRKCGMAVVLLLLLAACGGATPEEEAAKAAKVYYDRLAKGYAERFLEGKLGVDTMSSDFCEQLVKVNQMYLDELREKHGGLREVRISPNVGVTDTTLHVTYAFLLLCFSDSTQEEITVPMVEDGGRWCMK